MAITAQTRTEIIQLVVSMLGEAPSTAMLTDLVTKANAGSTIQELADGLATNAAFTGQFPIWQTSKEFTTKIVNNMFAGGTVSQADTDAAIDYIAGAITAGTFTKTSAVVALTSYMASADGLANATYGSASQAYQNKVTVAEYYTITKNLGDSSAAERKAAIDGVTDAASSVTSANEATDTAATAAAVVPGKVSALTTGQDSLTLSSGNDTISASLVANGAVGSTAQPGDSVKGLGGSDKMSLSVSGDSGGAYTLQALNLTGVETLHVSNFETDAVGGARDTITTVDTALMTGLAEVGLAASSAEGDTTFSNVANIVDVAMQNGAGDLTVGYTAAAQLGTNTQNVAVSNLSAGALSINGVETINLSSGLVKSTLASLASNKMKTLTVTGATDLKVTAALDFANDASGVAGAIDGTIDASAFTGKLTVTSAADEVSITGGSGNDTFNMVGTFNGFDKIDGGDGTDTLTMDSAALSTQFAQTSNIENVTFNAATATRAVDVSKLSAGVDKLTLDFADAADSGAKVAVTVSKADGKLINMARSAADTGADGGNDDGVTLAITDTTDSAADTVNVALTNIGLQANLKGIDSLDASTYETINITANTNALGTQAANEIVALTATVATSIDVGGTGAFNTALTGAKVTSFDASDLAGALTLTAGAEKATYSMGGKSSTITFAGNLNASDTVVGGAGAADIVTATVTGLTATTGALKLSDVEFALLTTSGNNTIDLSGSSALANLAVTDNKQTIKGLDLANTTVHLGLQADASATSSEIDVTGADATGTDDTLTVKVNSTAGATTSIIDASAIENLALTIGRNTTGTNNTTTLDLTTFEGAAVTVGTGALTAGAVVTAGPVALGTLNKATTSLTSTNKAAVTASFANATDPVSFSGVGTGIQNVTGGIRADTFTIGATAGVAHVLSGGAGTDTTNLTVFTGLVDVGSINTENVNLTVPASVDITIGTDFNAGVDNITLTGGNSLSDFDAGTINTAIKSIDGSAFLGKLVADFAADNLDGTVSITAAGSTKDEVTGLLNTDATYSPKTTAVEILDLDSNGTVTANLSGTTGVSRVEVDMSTAAKTFTVSNVAGQTVMLTGSANANNVLEATPVDATDTDNAIAFQLKDDATITADTKLKTTDVETVTITTSTAESIDLSLLTMSSATKTVTLNINTDPTTFAGVTLSATSAQTTTINAANAFGVSQTGRSATTAVNYTGSAGNDRFIMSTIGDNIAGGAGTGDTLDVNFAAVLGGISVDLSSAGNQIPTIDGGAPTGSVTGFESVDLAGFTGGGAAVTAIKTGSTIVGTGQNDRITGGAGADTITWTAGNDAVTGGGSNDTLKATIALLANQSGTTASFDMGGGTADALTLSDAGTIADADFVRITNLEVLNLGNGTQTVTLATNAQASGITTVTGGTGADTVDMNAYTAASTINGGGGADIITVATGAITTLNLATAGAIETVKTSAITSAGYANISNFAVAEDLLDFNGSVASDNGSSTAVNSNEGADMADIAAINTAKVTANITVAMTTDIIDDFLAGDKTLAELEAAALVSMGDGGITTATQTAIAGLDIALADTAKVLIFTKDNEDTAIFYVENTAGGTGGANVLATDEISLVGIIQGDMLTAAEVATVGI